MTRFRKSQTIYSIHIWDIWIDLLRLLPIEFFYGTATVPKSLAEIKPKANQRPMEVSLGAEPATKDDRLH